jgi:deazaflavin-dependent oxidoreductase (nitroreductase family)
MTTPDTVHDSPTGWVAEHIREYVQTGGAQGQIWQGVPTLLLTTTGRKTGAQRRTALIYGQLGDSYVVVASQGGAPTHPAWYLNLSEHPDVEVQVGPEVFAATARTATADERATLWPTMAAIWPAYNDYQTKTSRQIPVVVLDPISPTERNTA